MSRWRLALVASLAFHAAVLWLAYGQRSTAPEVRRAHAERIELTIVEPPPDPASETLPERPAPPPEAVPVTEPAKRRARRPVRTERAHEEPEASVEEAPASEGRRSMATEEEASVLAPVKEPGDGPSGGISLTLRRDAPTIHDVPLVPGAGERGGDGGAPRLGAAQENILARLRPQPGGGLVYEHPSFTAHIAYDGTVEFSDHQVGVKVDELGPRVWFDVTDAVTSLAGDTIYLSEKRRLMKVTRDLRLEMAERACEEHQRRSLVELKGQLEELFADASIDASARKRLVFRLWDDCAETGDERTVRFGLLARATIESYIRRYLPRGSEHAYSREELVALNATRISTTRFEPYRDG